MNRKLNDVFLRREFLTFQWNCYKRSHFYPSAAPATRLEPDSSSPEAGHWSRPKHDGAGAGSGGGSRQRREPAAKGAGSGGSRQRREPAAEGADSSGGSRSARPPAGHILETLQAPATAATLVTNAESQSPPLRATVPAVGPNQH